ncbi:ComEC/Rec2 family competence protein [Undibacterium crateris]|uniref:ComEC/Rec2 family competence protein n=1 Tax=Undibacterium crateris TaxID=2528175 RepID=UPI001389D59D|nr:MBL fold metallo-hydrolase [Undibacterium crateris]NDI85471.1 MBL fold metallo-hydrolase [Undibacterium crateris]
MSVKVVFFPAKCGDCFLLECSVNDGIFRILIDGGTPATADVVLAYLKKDGKCPVIDLVVVTHIDNDHIGGVIRLLKDTEFNAAVKEIWFNGISRIAKLPSGVKSLSVTQGVKLEEMLHDDARWNAYFGGAAVSINADGSPYNARIADGLVLDILSPGTAELAELKRNWSMLAVAPDPSDEEKDKLPAGVQSLSVGKDVYALAESKFDPDKAYANGSSIAFLLEIDLKFLLFTGDAFPDVITDAAELLQAGPIRVNVFKVSHHGSAGNTNERIVRKFPADYYLISTDGTHDHPHDEAIGRILVYADNPKSLIFNYPDTMSTWRGTDFEGAWSVRVQSHDGKTPIELDLGGA